MNYEGSFRPAGSHVVYQNMGGEVIVINLRDGFYFSITNAGSDIWEALVAGHSISSIIENIAKRYNVPTAEIEESCKTLLSRLVSESLLVQGSVTDQPGEFVCKQAEYKAPVIEKFVDMEDILMLDPIHDVSDAGWPNQ
jgi:hypothetical protein